MVDIEKEWHTYNFLATIVELSMITHVWFLILIGGGL